MKSGSSQKINLFEYQDYRSFLKDWFEAARASRSSMSFRRFSQKAGLKSSNFIMLVLQGKRNLTEDSAGKVAVALNLNKQEAEFFNHLVFFNQATGHEEKDRYYRLLLRSQKFQALEPLRNHQYEYCAAWYHSVIRELVACRDFDGSVDWIAERLYPRISRGEVEKSLELLQDLGLIRKNDEGKWEQSHTLLSTGAEVSSVALFNYHRNMLDLGKAVLEKIPGERRDISALTLGVKKDRLPQLKKMIQSFRQEILKIVSEDANPDEVIQVNIQMFPLTRAEPVERKEKR